MFFHFMVLSTKNMASLRDVRECLVLAYDEDVIDDEECALLYDVNRSKNLDYPYWKYERFHLDALDDT